ncbi:MAG: carbohydrate ABC transporter permease [Spirochaetia bacterium]|nr:carbohydrate ABC transporter permease [Spirochaetia bacterium]MDD7269246.1 carbohydrate ABC transporter permease [Treponema sp.]MDY4985791.1 carbohydrate ABC transporter permease [Treponema sp.]
MTKNKAKKALSVDNRSFWERNEASNGILLRETIKKYTISIFRLILLFGMCFMIIQPILNKIAVSFMAERDLYDTTIILVPKHFSISNWRITSMLMNYKLSLFNTMWVSVLVSIIEVFVCSLVGYGFSRFQFPLKRFWFFCVILIIVIPPQTISTSLFLHFRYFNLFGMKFNLSGSMLPYIMMCLGCMGLKNGLYIFMIRQFFMGFPFELEEAAYVDGCGPFKTFFRIMIPGAKPILTSCFLFSFVWQWTDSFYTDLFLGKISLLSTQISGLSERLGTYLTNLYGSSVVASVGYTNAILSTGVLLMIIPLIILYLFCQRLFVESLASTGVKM